MANLLMLPDEVKIKIFKYLHGVDKLQLLKVCEDLHRIGVDREVMQYLNFSNNYKVNFVHIKFIARKLTCFLVTELNINSIHWVPSAQLRNILSKFVNLTALHVLDTQLSFRDLTVVLNKTLKVTKLAMSLKPDNCADVFKVKIEIPITHLYVTYGSYSIRAFITLLTHFTELEELWLVECSVPFDIVVLDELPWTTYAENPLPKVSKRIILNRQYYKIPDKDYLIGSFKLNSASWVVLNETYTDDFIFLALENFNEQNSAKISYNLDNAFEENLRRIKNDFGMSDVFCFWDIRKLFLNKLSFSDMNFNSLNLVRQSSQADLDLDMCLKSFDTVLFSKNMKKLQKLRTESFPFWDQKENEDEVNVSLFKKRRIGVRSESTDENCIFGRFTKHATEIEDFELIDNDFRKTNERRWQLNSLRFISNWKILKKLTITSSNFRDGKFLIDITKSCPMLTCLKIKDDQMQDNLSPDLCKALQFAANIKDLRYERKGGIPVDLLFESLTKCQSLERLYVQCRFASKISKKPLETVIARCENLVFLFIFISELPETVCKSIKQSINEFGIKPQQIISIRGQAYTLRNITYEDIPASHIEDMVCQSNNFHCDFLRSFSY